MKMYWHFLFLDTITADNEHKNNKKDDDCSFRSIDGKMSKSEIKIARQSQRKRCLNNKNNLF